MNNSGRHVFTESIKYVECEVVCLKKELQSDHTALSGQCNPSPGSGGVARATTTALVCYAGGGGGGKLVAYLKCVMLRISWNAVLILG